MRLGPFITAHTEPILAAWDTFARTILAAAGMDSLALRDHAADILLATVRDMGSGDTAALRAERAGGYADGSPASLRLNGASAVHAIGRLGSGFDMTQLIAEYRALRASVLGLWRKSRPAPDERDMDDLNLFHESIDQSLATAVTAYTRRVNESRDMFLAILSHDLRNPLNAIAMSAQLLPRGEADDPDTAHAAATISTAAHVMARMIGDLLDYTRTRLGAGMPVAPAPTDLADCCRAVVGEFRAAHPTADLRLTATGDCAGRWDAARLRQVVSNLLGNAIQHGDPAAPVGVALCGDRAGVTLSVRNRGAPIPPGELTKIFDPLVRGAGAATPEVNRPGSIGLGLYIARELVHAHGGTIEVTSTAAAGTAFTFHLPHRPDGGDAAAAHPGAALSDA